MPLGGWKCEELTKVLNLSSPTKVTQSWDPAVLKVARAMLADPGKTLLALVDAIELIRMEIRVDGKRGLTTAELDRLQRMQTGRLDRRELGLRAPAEP